MAKALKGWFLKILSARAVRISVLFLLFLISLQAFAQPPYPSRLKRFQVDQIIGCAPFTINITNTDLIVGYSCPTCVMTYEAPVTLLNTNTHTFNSPGTYLVTVHYQSILVDPNDDIVITVLPNIKPSFEIYSCSANGAVINITDKNYDNYFVDFGDGTPVLQMPAGKVQHNYAASGAYSVSINGIKNNSANNCFPMVKSFQAVTVLPAPVVTVLTALDDNSVKLEFNAADNLQLRPQIGVNNSSVFQFLPDIYGVTVDTVRSLKVNNNYYCLRLNTHDACTGADIPSATICSQKFSVVPESDMNELSWVTEGAITTYDIDRDGNALANTAATTYADNNVVCNTQYCYQLTANYGNGTKSISLNQCVTAFTSKVPTRVENASSVVGTNDVDITWLQDPAFTTSQYTVLRKPSNDVFQQIATTAVPEYKDISYTLISEFCYRIDYTDQCNAKSPPGLAICPMRLSGFTNNQNSVQLSWNGYKGWKNGVGHYEVERFDQNGNVTKTASAGTDSLYDDGLNDTIHQVVSYRVTAYANDLGLTTSVSNVVVFVQDVHLYYPTAFTPNRDKPKINQTFTPRGFYITKLELRIFNRWGNLLFSSSIDSGSEPIYDFSQGAWDGTFGSKLQPNDTYVWTARVTDLTGKETSRTGTVILLTP